MDAGVITHEENALHPGWDLPIECGKQGDEFRLACASRCESCDLPCARIESGEQVEDSSALILMLHTSRQTWERRERRGQRRAWLEVGFLIEAQHPFPSSKRAGI